LRISDGTQIRTDSLRITVFPVPIVFSLTGGGSICSGDQGIDVGLSGSQQGITYSLLRNGFETGFNLSGTGSQLVFGNIQTAGNYTVRASNLSGCSQLMNGAAVVEVLNLPQNFVVFGGGATCANDNNIPIYLSGSESGVIYRLFHNGSNLVQQKTGTGLPISFANPSATGTYTVEAARDLTYCTRLMQGTAQVLLYPVPQPTISGSGEVCAGAQVTLTASGGLDYQWVIQPAVSGPVLQLVPLVTTTYAVNVANGFGCVSTATATVTVNDNPVFELIDDKEAKSIYVQNVQAGASIIFRNGTTVLQHGTSLMYYYGGVSLPNDTIVVEAISTKGCRWSSWITIGPEVHEIRINAFSPNGDQVNDRFMAGSHIRVFNRWGVEIYSGTEGWDGTYKGTFVSPGTYYYLHEIKDLTGATVRIVKGSVTLVRE
jgi:gliding motility-associated-like protein